ncbi:SRPBCC family protein [Arthrobacter crystallopoietes]|uniref:SRPBCC family protein n=1 Tax=Crystallibacter crystallopoietes TaxID=37928 RepID=UPI001ABDA732|nr:SRPBCC domain-containing protein [Arthrobacter crystallopoietes]QTG82121.1 SRPBCC domain-containing protein [Arthrobacter crystallopoietes]
MNEHKGLALALECLVEAPRPQVFSLLSEPEWLAKWWGPAGFTLPAATTDFRVGGSYRFSMQPPEGELFHLAGEFLEIEPPVRLVYTFRWEEPAPDDRQTVVVLLLEEEANATRIFLEQRSFATEERLELHRAGWTESFAKLRELLSSLQ